MKIENLKPISNVYELRIDSLVFNKHHEVSRFGYMDFYAYKHPQMGGNYGFYGIPLSEKWLTDLGLKEYELGYYRLTDETLINVDGQVYAESDDNSTLWITECHFVHSLQNLYHALTGQELQSA